MKIVVIVTHLLGTGHLSRALTLARAFAKAGHSSTVVSGGMPAPHLDSTGVSLLQLPPLRSDGVNFTRLLNAKNIEVTQELMQARKQMLGSMMQKTQPDVLITELFPFGRRVLGDEFRHVLDCARAMTHPPLICASVRDILAPPSKPEKAAAAETLIKTCYDAVLVHSDPEITPLGASWPVTEALSSYLHYTGFVAPPPPQPSVSRSRDVLVSAGGGDVGAELFAVALQAARLDPTRQWHLLVGGARAQALVGDLHANAPSNAVIEPARADFQQLLQRAGASVSMCGYNTALDVLQTGTHAVFVPFDAGGEVEQTLRAKTLAKLPGIILLPTAQLSTSALLQHLTALEGIAQRPPQTHGMNGALNTVKIVETLRHAS